MPRGRPRPSTEIHAFPTGYVWHSRRRRHSFDLTVQSPVTASAPSVIGETMDSVVTEDRSGADERFDTARITAAVDALAEKHSGREDVFRAALAQLLKAEMIAARATAQAVLLKDRHGRRCAERLCFMQDEIIRILYSAATRHLYRSHIPSGAERMAVVATGGYGRGLMAPESDIDLLFILPYKQTAWGEQVAEAILYCLWDMGLKVGHATRSVDESIRQARGDMTIRTAILETRFLTGDQPLYDELVARFDKEVVQGTAAEFVTAKLAEREERHRRAGQSRYLVEPNVKDGKGGLRDLHTLFWIAKYVYRVRQAGRPAGQAGAGAEPHDGSAAAQQQPAAGARERRFHRRQQPHQSRSSRCVQAGPGQSDPDFPPGAEEQPCLSPGRHAHGDAFAEADQQPASRRSGRQPAVYGNPDCKRCGDRAAADERDRRARPL